jgi:hypothetical protein
MQIGEKTHIAKHSKYHDEECPFCKAEKEKIEERLNELVDDLDEKTLDETGADVPQPGTGAPISETATEIIAVAVKSYMFKNDSGKLGAAIKEPKPEKEITLKSGTEPLKVGVAAHHLIPGGGSLAKSKIMKYLHVDGKKEGNIGYNVNSAENGVWLPGNYAVRPWSSHSEGFKEQYAPKAIAKCGAQFHDAHTEYNKFVKGVLDKTNLKLHYITTICETGKEITEELPPEKRPPLSQLLVRLNHLSSRMKHMLTGAPSKWRLNVFTSSRSKHYMKDIQKIEEKITEKNVADEIIPDKPN